MTLLNFTTHEKILSKMMISFQYRPQTQQEAKELIETYFKSFSKIGIDDTILSNVAERLIYTWKPQFGVKFPPVKDFIDIAGVSASSIGEKAFKAIESRIKTLGNYHPLELGEKPEAEHKRSVTFEVIRLMGGWVTIATSGATVWEKRKGEFLSLFEGLYYKDIPVTDYLLGSSNIQNDKVIAKYNKNQITDDETH